MKLNAQVLITDDEIDIADYVITLSRDWILCSSIQTFDILLDPNVRDILPEGVELKPSLKCVIYEHGVKVFTGHINTVKFQRKPDSLIVIQGADNYKFVKDYFIDESLGTSNGETVAYWVGIIMDACGQNYSITSSEANSNTVAPGIEFNLKSADDAIRELLAYSFSHAYANQNGTIVISSGDKSSNISFKSGPTTVYDDNDPTIIGGGNVIKASHQTNDSNTRTIIKVWGWKGSDPWLDYNESPYIQAIAYGEQSLPVDKTMLYSSSMIQDSGTAQNLANRMAAEMGHYDSIKTVECIGNPDIMITQNVGLHIDLESETLTGRARITSIHSSMGQDGYIMQVKMDEFCPKFAAWSSVAPPQIFYAGTLKHGVYKSIDGGVNWFEYNNSLPSGIKNVSSLATTSDDEVMAIINSKLYYTTSSGLDIPLPPWVQKTLPAPTNAAGDSPAPGYGRLVMVTSAGFDHSFEVLTANSIRSTVPILPYSGGTPIYPALGRSWVYSTTNAGESWKSDQLYYDIPPSGIVVYPSGWSGEISYNLNGQYMSNRYGLPVVTASTFVTTPGLERRINNIAYLFEPGATYLDPTCATLIPLPYQNYDLGIHYVDFTRNVSTGEIAYDLYGKFGHRTMRFGLMFYTDGGWPFTDTQVTPDGWRMRGDTHLYLQAGIGNIPMAPVPIPAYLCNIYATEGVRAYQTAIRKNTVSYIVEVQEDVFGPEFWIKFGMRIDYIYSRGLDQALIYVYAGEDAVFSKDCYPWTYWPTWPKPIKYEDTYPMTLRLAWLSLNMDDFITTGYY